MRLSPHDASVSQRGCLGVAFPIMPVIRDCLRGRKYVLRNFSMFVVILPLAALTAACIQRLDRAHRPIVEPSLQKQTLHLRSANGVWIRESFMNPLLRTADTIHLLEKLALQCASRRARKRAENAVEQLALFECWCGSCERCSGTCQKKGEEAELHGDRS